MFVDIVYTLCLLILAILTYDALFIFKDCLMMKFGKVVDILETEAIIENKEVSSMMSPYTGVVRSDFFLVFKSLSSNATKKILVSEDKYNQILIGEKVKVYEILYKYRNMYFKDLVYISELDPSNYKQCDEKTKEFFILNKDLIVHKCAKYECKKNRILASIKVICNIFVALLFICMMLPFFNETIKFS